MSAYSTAGDGEMVQMNVYLFIVSAAIIASARSNDRMNPFLSWLHFQAGTRLRPSSTKLSLALSPCIRHARCSQTAESVRKGRNGCRDQSPMNS